MRRVAIAGLLVMGIAAAPSAQSDQPTIFPLVRTVPLASYDEAPATPDADDPAIWINRDDHRRSLVIGTSQGCRTAGLRPVRSPGSSAAAANRAADSRGRSADTRRRQHDPDDPCADSASGDTFGRYNNVDIAYDLKLGTHPGAPRADVAVVSDRGCDRVRFFRIDPSNPDGPLVDITSPGVPRVFRAATTSPRWCSRPATAEGWAANPLDDQNTVYGLTVRSG